MVANEIQGERRFVSRGGIKLDHALAALGVDAKGKVILDAGASTGGFTDCLLKRGAAKVYAVDVGYGQFDWRLRNDPRVVLMERTNVRYLDPSRIGEPCDLVVADLAFISLPKVLQALEATLRPGGEMVLLVKPQFELGPGKAKKGVVRDPALQDEAVNQVALFAQKMGLKVLGRVPSPIRGPKGNQEHFLHLRKNPKSVK